MSFQFTSRDLDDVGLVYDLPPLPYGVSYQLTKLIDAYADAVRDGTTDDSEEEHYAAIAAFDPRSVSDVIAKCVMQLHYDHKGVDGETLVLCPLNENRCGVILSMQGVLADLYRQLPDTWDAVLGAVRAALLAEQDYDRRVWRPALEIEKAGGPRVSAEINAEIERLQDVRCDAEDFLIQRPAENFEQFATKYLIAFSWGRDLSGHHDDLCKEARRLLGISDPGAADELDCLLSNLNWSEV